MLSKKNRNYQICTGSCNVLRNFVRFLFHLRHRWQIYFLPSLLPYLRDVFSVRAHSVEGHWLMCLCSLVKEPSVCFPNNNLVVSSIIIQALAQKATDQPFYLVPKKIVELMKQFLKYENNHLRDVGGDDVACSKVDRYLTDCISFVEVIVRRSGLFA